jgi:hypothetical protein
MLIGSGPGSTSRPNAPPIAPTSRRYSHDDITDAHRLSGPLSGSRPVPDPRRDLDFRWNDTLETAKLVFSRGEYLSRRWTFSNRVDDCIIASSSEGPGSCL